MKFNEDKYQKALKALAQQVVAMVKEDEGDENTLNDYMMDTVGDLQQAAEDLFECS